jgi:copper chaperone CopZ
MRSQLYWLAVAVFSVSLVGCNEATNAELSVPEAATTPAAFNADGAPTVQFSVPDMMCPESCAVKVKEILSEQPGAKDVVVDFDSKTATVAIDKDKFDADAAIAALVDHAYDHSTLKPAADDAKAAPVKTEQPAKPAAS